MRSIDAKFDLVGLITCSEVRILIPLDEADLQEARSIGGSNKPHGRRIGTVFLARIQQQVPRAVFEALLYVGFRDAVLAR